MKDKLFGLLEPVVTALGYELLEVEWSSAGRNSLVRVYIDRTDGGGIGLDDCERASRSIAAVLDAADPIGALRGALGGVLPEPPRARHAGVRPAVADGGAFREVRGQRGAHRARGAD